MKLPQAKTERRHREAALEWRSDWRGVERTVLQRVNDEAWLKTGRGYNGTGINRLARAFAGFEKLGRAERKK